jgi:CRISPR-associated Csx14 family protein
MENILIASLGESPIVITAMYHLLTEREGVDLKQVLVLCPKGEARGKDIPTAVDLIREALRSRCEVIEEQLPFDDADTVETSFTFLQTLYRVLDTAQKSEQSVYLSLAGGRKNMSAIMALLVPLFPCVKGLYHVLDKDEGSRHRAHFKSIEDIIALSDADRFAFFSPDLDRLTLIPIPYNSEQQVSEAFRSRLFMPMTEEQLEDLWDENPEEAEIIEAYQPIIRNTPVSKPLKILLTSSARKAYERMLREDRFHAERFSRCFEKMKNPLLLKAKIHGSGFTRGSLSFHFFKRGETAERPFYHTEPEDVYYFPNVPVEKVIISALEIERGGHYKAGEQLVRAYDPKEATIPLDDILPARALDSILVVPLGMTPMIATQLYTLLTRQGHTIRQVVLVYPAQARAIQNGADLLKQAFAKEHADVNCLHYTVPGYGDINSKEACLAYERTLEQAIDAARSQHPNCQVLLALSGGRKGMAALAMFVAQRKGIHFVYHTLITDKAVNDKVAEETSITELRDDPKVRNDRLFLRAYESDGPYTPFTLFKVPVLPARG